MKEQGKNITQQAVAIFNKYAAEYEGKYMDVSLYHDVLDLFCDYIPNKNAHVLEIACGPGNLTAYVLNKRPDLRILGIDLAENMIALAKKNNPAAEFRVMDCRDIVKLDKKFDAIICGFCLPYLSKEEVIKLLSDAATILHPHGVLYISTMEDDYSKSGITKSSKGDELYIYYHPEDQLTKALEENGFTILDMQYKDSVNTDGTKTSDIVIIAQYR